MWWNWQTRYFEVVVPQGVQVQVLPCAPNFYPSSEVVLEVNHPHNLGGSSHEQQQTYSHRRWTESHPKSFCRVKQLRVCPQRPKSEPAKRRNQPAVESSAPKKNRGRVDIIREKAGRGGKTVTVVKGFVGIGLPEKEKLAKAMQKVCGTGGTVKDGQIEIQGDQREAVARILTEANFRPVFAGG